MGHRNHYVIIHYFSSIKKEKKNKTSMLAMRDLSGKECRGRDRKVREE